MLLRVISQCGPFFLHPPKKGFPPSSTWPRREYTWTLSWKEGLLICFENCQGVPYSHRQSRDRMMNTFIIVSITPIYKRELEDKSMLLHSRKTFILLSVWPGTDYIWAIIWKKSFSLLICFESYQGIPYSYTGWVDGGWWTLYYFYATSAAFLATLEVS